MQNILTVTRSEPSSYDTILEDCDIDNDWTLSTTDAESNVSERVSPWYWRVWKLIRRCESITMVLTRLSNVRCQWSSNSREVNHYWPDWMSRIFPTAPYSKPRRQMMAAANAGLVNSAAYRSRGRRVYWKTYQLCASRTKTSKRELTNGMLYLRLAVVTSSLPIWSCKKWGE